jgi:hypothetical protein
MRTPIVFSAEDIKTWSVTKSVDGHIYTLARPISWSGLNIWKRITAAWLVFSGKADVLVWYKE